MDAGKFTPWTCCVMVERKEKSNGYFLIVYQIEFNKNECETRIFALKTKIHILNDVFHKLSIWAVKAQMWGKQNNFSENYKKGK